METKASHVLVGLFVLALLVGAVAFALWSAKPETVAEQYYVVHFPGDVTGLAEGNDVRFQGVRVGEVRSIEINPATGRIDVVIQVKEGTPVRTDTTARLEIMGITGVSFIQLRTPTKSRAAAEEPAQLMPGSSEPPYPKLEAELSSLQKVFADFPKTLEKIGTAAEQLANLMSDQNIDRISQSMENVRVITDNLRESTDDISRVFDTAEQTLVQVQDLSQQMNGAVGDVQEGAQSFTQLSRSLNTLVEENRRPINDFTATGLYELSRFLTEARVLVRSLTRLTDELEKDPARFLFGDKHQGIQAE